jgi:hypothetical protein
MAKALKHKPQVAKRSITLTPLSPDQTARDQVRFRDITYEVTRNENEQLSSRVLDKYDKSKDSVEELLTRHPGATVTLSVTEYRGLNKADINLSLSYGVIW